MAEDAAAPGPAEKPESAAAEKTGRNPRNDYFGIHIVQSNYAVKFADSSKRNYRASGIGFIVGRAPPRGFGFEIEWGGARIYEKGVGLNASYADNYNIMVRGKYSYEIAGFFRPYAGVGIGPSLWITDGGKWNFSYQGFAGISLNLTSYFDADFRLAIQNLGRMPDDHVFKTAGNVIETATRVGVLWKY